MKIAILGYSGSGKSTLAKRLAEFYGIPVLFLDTVQYLPNWVERDRVESCSIVRNFMSNESWIIDGNYKEFLQNERLQRADRIIILNFPRAVCFCRAVRRYLQNKNRTRESMADGCIEKLDPEFIWWILYRGRTRSRRDHYRRIASRYPSKTVILKTRNQIERFILDVFRGSR
ncbi:hypothetical protein CAFE_14540 [Caprobacter fermentans]|uniref:DNA topology modulation protein FlaR n=1 Tax=Caproicibacter fermentans TaxID=2576756 RepID=A0A6N8HY55_9FIRM|nr:DNA topology modulation protein FlaR [Caproicibacter fermentans]MVB10756.1 hypothetical protein [Caproicibacter fermentans]